MRVQGCQYISFGILKHHIVKNASVGKLDILKGETSRSFVGLYREYLGNSLDLKYCFSQDKKNGHLKSKIQHIKNGKVIRTVKHGF